eukprot:scaffold114084_cov63-Phaeocystis_antarctica.AAC.3
MAATARGYSPRAHKLQPEGTWIEPQVRVAVRRAEVCGEAIEVKEVRVRMQPHTSTAIGADVAQRAAARALGEAPQPRVGGRAQRMVEEGDRVERRGIVVHHTLVAALRVAVDREVPPGWG